MPAWRLEGGRPGRCSGRTAGLCRLRGGCGAAGHVLGRRPTPDLGAPVRCDPIRVMIGCAHPVDQWVLQRVDLARLAARRGVAWHRPPRPAGAPARGAPMGGRRPAAQRRSGPAADLGRGGSWPRPQRGADPERSAGARPAAGGGVCRRGDRPPPQARQGRDPRSPPSMARDRRTDHRLRPGYLGRPGPPPALRPSTARPWPGTGPCRRRPGSWRPRR